eukprot:GSChrysophyteH1.ASY1.ANO1.3216.1 assembled CDS
MYILWLVSVSVCLWICVEASVMEASTVQAQPSAAAKTEQKRLKQKYKYNIALHAQVAPDPQQIVGSVITTDGLKAALNQRADVGIVEVFYPFKYDTFFATKWDVVIIEGWFLMIHDFIALVRSQSPETVIVFFCLDPSFPGLGETLTYDVDGFMTNSQSVYDVLSESYPTELVLLAADPDQMKPATSHSHGAAKPDATDAADSAGHGGGKTYNVVFIGAGGRMLEYKPHLKATVQAALPFGLHLYGMGWQESAEADIRAAHRGVLPHREIASVYSSARVVLAHTIQSQRDSGMVNNRVFEAMSCGGTSSSCFSLSRLPLLLTNRFIKFIPLLYRIALVLSDWFPAVEMVTEGTALLANNTADITRHLEWAMSHPAEAAMMGEAARKLILTKHSWSHRAVQILSFVNHLVHTRRASRQCCLRPSCPTMAWVTGSSISAHSDYQTVVNTQVYAKFCQQYKITRFTELEFLQGMTGAGATGDMSESTIRRDFLAQFEVVFSIFSPFDSLHLHYLQANNGGIIPELTDRIKIKGHERGYGRLQKWVGFILGTDDSSTRRGVSDGRAKTLMLWDVLLFRSHVEIQAFKDAFKMLDTEIEGGVCRDSTRCEHVFGFDTHDYKQYLRSMSDGGESDQFASDSSSDSDSDNDSGVPVALKPLYVRGTARAPAENGTDGMSNFEMEKGFEKRLQELSKPAKDESIESLAVCYAQYKQLCTIQRLESLAGPEGIPRSRYHWLLIGGSWADWLENPTIPLNYSDTNMSHAASLENIGDSSAYWMADLHRTIHVASGRAAWLSLSLFFNAKKVYFLHGGDGIQSRRGSIDDVVWPVLLAALASVGPSSVNAASGLVTGPSIKLLAFNGNLVAVAKDNIRQWNGSYMAATVARCVGKAHNLGSGVARLQADPIGVVEYQWAVPEPDGRAGTLDVVMRLEMQNFMPGRDGDCCISLRLPNSQPEPLGNPMDHKSNKTCLLRMDRPQVRLRIALYDNLTRTDAESCFDDGIRTGVDGVDISTESRINTLKSMVSQGLLDVHLRGNVFSDRLYTVRIPVSKFPSFETIGDDQVESELEPLEMGVAVS